MNRLSTVLVVATLSFCQVSGTQAQSTAAASPQASAPVTQASAPSMTAGSSTADATVLLRAGFDALTKRDYTRSLALADQVIAVDSGSVPAYNLAGNSSIGLHDYFAAVDSFRRALQGRPTEPHNLSGLMRAYTLAGMAKERDAERETLQQMSREGKVPADFHYVFDTFTSGDKRVDVSEFPVLGGTYNYRYNFDVNDAHDQVVLRIALESDELDQAPWRQQHASLAAKGAREFSLDGYATDADTAYHFTYAFFDGEPTYESVRKQVTEVVEGSKKPISSGRRPLNQTTQTPQAGPTGTSFSPR